MNADSAAAPVSFIALNRIGRNDPCPCGSGKKYKKCCLPKDEAAARQRSRAAQVTPRLLQDETSIQAAPSVASPDSIPDLDDEPWDQALPPETRRRLDELWNAFKALSKPTAE